MKSFSLKNRGSLKALALVCGLAVSGLIIGQGLTQNGFLASEDGSVSSFKESIKKNKNLIVNTYLLGVSIYKETVE